MVCKSNICSKKVAYDNILKENVQTKRVNQWEKHKKTKIEEKIRVNLRYRRLETQPFKMCVLG